MHHLAVMDFLLEHFEDIPAELLNRLCSPSRGVGIREQDNKPT
jgi:hypothetical protein